MLPYIHVIYRKKGHPEKVKERKERKPENF
jgi:hypothetical protein